MSAIIRDIALDLNSVLRVEKFKDYCVNGLQVEAGESVTRLVTGVTASQALIEAAIETGAQLLLVHHGYFWRGEEPQITGMKGRRIQSLMRSGISLLAYHLPLDAHPELGNNAQLGRVLGFTDAATLEQESANGLVMTGNTPHPMSFSAFSDHLAQKLGHHCVAVSGGNGEIQRVAWCTGAAQGFIDIASSAGVDAYVTGEISEQTTHFARENDIHFFAAGHHATERYGVQAVGQYLANKFSIEHRFIDIDNPA